MPLSLALSLYGRIQPKLKKLGFFPPPAAPASAVATGVVVALPSAAAPATAEASFGKLSELSAASTAWS